jgi:hypothetical protein
MRPSPSLVVCVIAVGICSYIVDTINHKRQSRAGFPSGFSSARNMLLAAVLVGLLTVLTASKNDDSDGTLYSAQMARLAKQAVIERTPRPPASLAFE